VSNVSPWNSMPAAGKRDRGASMSSTCSAVGAGEVKCSIPMFSGTITLSVRFPVSSSAKLRSRLYAEHRRPSVSR
jgi:hypothetical protein